jgi:hypothetical protein
VSKCGLKGGIGQNAHLVPASVLEHSRPRLSAPTSSVQSQCSSTTTFECKTCDRAHSTSACCPSSIAFVHVPWDF